jgi:hypothetical protein
LPAITHLPIDRHRHRLGWLIDLDEDVGNCCLARGASETYGKQLGNKKTGDVPSLFLSPFTTQVAEHCAA